MDLAEAADLRGWDGLFVWDHVLSPIPGEWDLADPWIALAAAATVTRRIRLGTMVTPLPRRRVIKLARETVTLDRLSDGRLILGLGLGGDMGRELSAFGENTDARRLARVLDEGTEVLTDLWAGMTVRHLGDVTADAVRATPGPVQKPRIPIWFGTQRCDGPPIARAARYDGVFPLEAKPEDVKHIRDQVTNLRGDLAGFDIAVVSERGTDLGPLRDAGATWAMHAFWPGHRPDQILRFIDGGAPLE
ncbi:MAG: LLM class flavin-dependent oxidoreductase [Mycobacteriaceae bacterium]|nr:LLM class flavin-dependent oxidoreductase [Mycobacteriaceae bacterium]